MGNVDVSRIVAELILTVFTAIVSTSLALAALWLVVKLRLWIRRCKVDCRIKRQAKAAGVWDKPQAMGGRALEIYAWEHCGIKRRPGETDKELRNRCRTAGFTPKKNGKPAKGNKLDSLAWEDYRIKRKPGETDEQLRARCKEALDNEYANTPWC